MRPTRIITRRANELLCVIRYAEDGEDAKWLNETDVDTGGLIERALEDTDLNILIHTMGEWME